MKFGPFRSHTYAEPTSDIVIRRAPSHKEWYDVFKDGKLAAYFYCEPGTNYWHTGGLGQLFLVGTYLTRELAEAVVRDALA